MKVSDLEYIKNHYSDKKNKDIAYTLNISIATVIRTAKKYNLKKVKDLSTVSESN